MVTHSSILAWEMLWKQSLVGYSPWGHRGVRHDLVTEQQGKYYSLNWIFPTCLPVMPSDARQGCFGYVNLLGFFLPPGVSQALLCHEMPAFLKSSRPSQDDKTEDVFTASEASKISDEQRAFGLYQNTISCGIQNLNFNMHKIKVRLIFIFEKHRLLPYRYPKAG